MPFQLRKYLDGIRIPFLEKNKNSVSKLFFDYKDIANMIKDESNNFLITLYFNKENTENILYESEELITIKNNDLLKRMKNLFYLDLLIMNTPYIINYTFSGEVILTLYKAINTIKEKPIKIITCKIIIDLIESYKGFGNNEDKLKEEKLGEMTYICKKEILNLFDNNGKKLQNLNYVIEQSIDIIYMDIFIKLIKEINQGNINFDDVYNILNKLEIEEIYITENMFKQFQDFIESSGNILGNFFINEIEDLINISKINFYYIILKYFLKKQIFIYQFKFLLNTRKFIIDLINNNLYTLIVLVADLVPSLGQKLEYIIKEITDIGYYFEIYLRKKQSLKEELKNKKLRYIYPLIPIIEESIKNKENESQNDVTLENWEKISKLIKEKKLKKMPKSIFNKLLKYFQDEKNKYLLLKIFSKEEYESFKILEEENDNHIDEKEEKEEDEEKNNLNEDNVIGESIQIEEENISKIRDNFEKDFKTETKTSMIIESITLTTNKENKELVETELNSGNITDLIDKIDVKMYYKSNKFKIIEQYKTIEKKYNYVAFPNFTKNLSKGHYITMQDCKTLTLYDHSFEKKLEINFYENIRNLYEIENKNNFDIINLIICFKNELSLLSINIQNYSYYLSTKFRRKNISIASFFKIDDNNFLINGERGGFIVNEKNMEKIEKIFSVNYTDGIKLNKKIYAFTSNQLMPQGKDKLIIYDFSTKNIIKEFSDDYSYSFSFTSNGLCLINTNEIKNIDEKRQILLCTCKKGKEKKNGFLVLNMDLEKKEKVIYEYFYETKNFEPYCISQISNVENNNSINGKITNERNINIEETEFFMVGGFDPDKRMGIIKLYKIQVNKKDKNIKVRYLIDIGEEDTENSFKGFDSNITCIIQSKITGNLLINSLDGNINLFKPPNLECFIRK